MKDFKGRHFDKDVILTDVRWYCKFALSLRDIEELLEERNIFVDRTTIYRWNIKYIPEIKKRLSKHIRPSNDLWRMDETYIKVKGEWVYLYREVDTNGDTIYFHLSKKRNTEVSRIFFKKALKKNHNKTPRVITTDKWKPTENVIKSITELENTEHRNLKFLNNIVESDHRRIKRITRQMLGIKSFKSASILIDGIEIAAMFKKEQIKNIVSIHDELQLIHNQLFCD